MNLYCVASIYAYRLLEREGFLRVRRYAGGIADWEDAGYPVERDARGHRQPQLPATLHVPRLGRPCLVWP
jgi:3-mercaptopyruvate sulfurtransferase SseA